MEAVFTAALNNMLMILALMIIGYILNRTHLIPASLETVVSKLIVYIFLPALLINTFMTQCTPENLRANTMLILYGTGFFFLSILAATFVTELIAHHDENLRGIYRYSLTFPNTGGVGTPLMLAMYGTAGYFQLSLFILPFSIGTYVWGIEQLRPLTKEHPKHRLSLRGLFNAAMVAELIGFLLGITGVAQYLPAMIPDTLSKLGGCYPLLSLILLGYVIADYDPKEIIDIKADVVISLFRLILFPAAFLGLLTLLGAPQIVRVVTAIAFACPCGMNTVVYGTAFGQDSRIGAGLLLVTNLLAVLTMPLMQLLI